MKSWKAALIAMVAVAGSTAILQAATAEAQVLDSLRERTKKQQPQQQRQQARIGTLDARESAAVLPMYQAAQAQDWAAARTAMPQARAGASSPAGRFLVGQLMFQLARGTQDRALESEAVSQMIQSGGATPEQLAELQALQSNATFDAAVASGNFGALETQLEQRLAAAPNDAALMEQLATVKVRLNKHGEALALMQRAAQGRQAAGQPITAEMRQRLAGLAYQARSPDTPRYMREWLVAAPSANAWHDTLAIYSELGNATPALKLDIYRLMRVAGAMTSERDYVEYAEAANEARSYAEVKAVLEEGLRRNLFAANAGWANERLGVATQRSGDRSSLPGERSAALAGSDAGLALRLGDTFYGYGDYAAAAELYRAALQKGGQDASLLNIRLAAALAQAGDRAGAEAALRTVAGGPRAELAQLWLLWLSQPRG